MAVPRHIHQPWLLRTLVAHAPISPAKALWLWQLPSHSVLKVRRTVELGRLS